MREPHLTECCGHNYCASCILTWLKSPLPDTCPLCRSDNFIHIQDKRLERQIRAMPVRCCHASKGCGWVGCLSDLSRHLTSKSEKGCGFVPCECTLGCGACMLRKDLPAHTQAVCRLRKVICEYCGVGVTCEEMMTNHHTVCPLMDILCEKGCGKTMKRCEAATHFVQECPNCTVQCPFYDECNTTLARKDFDQHVSMCKEKNLLKAFTKLKTDLEAMKKENWSLKHQLVETKQIAEKCQKGIESVYNVTQAMKTALQQELHYLHSSNNPSDVVALQCIHTHLSGKNVCLREGGEAATFRMTNYAEHKATGQVWYTPFFHIDHGYQFCIALHLNGTGIGKDTHVSLYLHQVKGERDSYLTWPFLLEGIFEVNFMRQTNVTAKTSWLKGGRAKHGKKPAISDTTGSQPATSPKFLRKRHEPLVQPDDCHLAGTERELKLFTGSPSSKIRDRSRSAPSTNETKDLILCSEECQELHLNVYIDRPEPTDTKTGITAPIGQLEMFCLQKIADNAVCNDSLVLRCGLNPPCTTVDCDSL